MSKRKYWFFKLEVADEQSIYMHVNKSSKGNYRYASSDTLDGEQTELYVGKKALSVDGYRKLLGLSVKECTLVPEYLEIVRTNDPIAPNRELAQVEYKL